jgi:hypothetical protein
MSNTYDFPIKKDYELNVKIELSFWEKVDFIEKKLKYSQANILDTMRDFNKMSTTGASELFTDFLKENGFQESEIILLGLQKETFEKLFIMYFTTRYRWAISEESLKKPATETEIPKEENSMPYHAMLVLIADKLKIDPLTFQERYTFEQMIYLSKWIEYMLNTKSEEGQKKNKEKYGKTEEYDSMLLERLKLV